MAGVKEKGKRKGCRIFVHVSCPFLQVSIPNPHVKESKIELKR